MRNYMTKSEFARHCNVAPTSVTRGIKQKQVSVASNGLIDANNATNQEFMQHHAEWKAKTASGKLSDVPYAERVNARQAKVVIEPVDDEPDELPEDEDLPPLPPKRPPTPEEAALIAAGMSEIDYAIEKMRSTTAINKARLAEMVKATVRRDFVDRVISMIGTAISDHLITLGDRLSPDLAAIAGSTEASVIRRIKQTLDDDISAALHEMQRVVAEKYEKRLEV